MRLLTRFDASTCALLCAAILAGACARGQPNFDALNFASPAPQSVDRIGEVPFPTGEADASARSQIDVFLTAIAEDDHVRIQIRNRTSSPLLIGPGNFGLIPSGSDEVIRINKRLYDFPPSRLEPGGSTVGLLQFPGVEELRGSRLVFYHPECRPAFALIQ